LQLTISFILSRDWPKQEHRFALSPGPGGRRLAPATINLRLAAVRHLAFEAAATGLLSPELAAGIGRVRGAKRVGVRLGNWLRRMLGNGRNGSSTTAETRKYRISAAGRRAIAGAQRQRWAEQEGATGTSTAKVKKPKRKLSAAGRAAIVAALKKR
jgi:hypothetical protein